VRGREQSVNRRQTEGFGFVARGFMAFASASSVGPAALRRCASASGSQRCISGCAATKVNTAGATKAAAFGSAKIAVHLTHPANTLGAEINLAADATVLYPAVAAAPAASLPARLICCAQYGGVNRSSDPHIGAAVNAAARGGRMVTLANPVGLYMGTIDRDGLRDPADQPIGARSLAVTRASADGTMILRAVLAPPAGAAFTLDQCSLGGEGLRGGAQVARRITMSLFGLVKRAPVAGRVGATAGCSGKCCPKLDAPNFRVPVGATQDCAALGPDDFADEAPWTEDVPLPAPDGLKSLPHHRALEGTEKPAPFTGVRVPTRGVRGGGG